MGSVSNLRPYPCPKTYKVYIGRLIFSAEEVTVVMQSIARHAGKEDILGYVSADGIIGRRSLSPTKYRACH